MLSLFLSFACMSQSRVCLCFKVARSCYRHFCASQHGAWNVNNLRDPKSPNMLFLPLEEQGQQTTALQISLPLKKHSKQVNFGSKQLLQRVPALHSRCNKGYLRCKAGRTKATCVGRNWTCGGIFFSKCQCPGSFQKGMWSKDSPNNELRASRTPSGR